MRNAIRLILVLGLATLGLAATAGASVRSLSVFQSPTHNIGCVIAGSVARCDINHRQWSPPPHPASCSDEVDFGQGLNVGLAGRARLVCAGDTALNPHATVLHYGQAARHGSFTCNSATTGMTCTDTRDGHGFFISIQSYRIF
jgi:hypothetical protein